VGQDIFASWRDYKSGHGGGGSGGHGGGGWGDWVTGVAGPPRRLGWLEPQPRLGRCAVAESCGIPLSPTSPRGSGKAGMNQNAGREHRGCSHGNVYA
jgi:hypothetical protein